ncbi:hypothetical protein BCR44DRAFT_38074 [Catenaria anguillulae PL171]|uniref:Uncharacterized protein n=1 Tax=Catenaria anguillulae PL171 TaxID=765915 RepID=A0A1Y2I5K4_9FUNG|nr:hypothetical protein BCR44DRAFT_38074 [Catenaria anguillulae PL171]
MSALSEKPNNGSPPIALGPVYYLRNPTANLARLFAVSADVPVTNLCDPTDPQEALAQCRRPLLVSSNTQPQQQLSPYAQCLSTKCAPEWQSVLELVTRASNSITPLSASDVHAGTQLHMCGIRSCSSELTIQLSTTCVPWSALPAGTALDRPPDPLAMSADLVSRYTQVLSQPNRIGACLPSLPIGSPCSGSSFASMFDRDGLLVNTTLPQPSTNGNDGLIHLPDSFPIPTTNLSAMYRIPPSLLRTPSLAVWVDRNTPNFNVPDNTFSLFFCSPRDNTIQPAILPGSSSSCLSSTNTSCVFTSCLPATSQCANPPELIKRPIARPPPATRSGWDFNPLYIMPGVFLVATLISLFAWIQNKRMIRSKKTRSILDRDRALRPADRRMLDVSAVQEAGMVGRPGDVLPRYAHHGFDLRPEWHPPNEEDLIYTEDGVEVAEVRPADQDEQQEQALAAAYDRPPDEPVDAAQAVGREERERAELAALYLAGAGASGGGARIGMSSFTASPLPPPNQARTRVGSQGAEEGSSGAAGSLQAQQFRRQRSGISAQLAMGRSAII